MTIDATWHNNLTTHERDANWHQTIDNKTSRKTVEIYFQLFILFIETAYIFCHHKANDLKYWLQNGIKNKVASGLT